MRGFSTNAGRVGAAVWALSIGLLAGCVSSKPAQAPVAAGPEWVNKGSGAFKDGGAGVFYGVGMAAGIRNPALARSSADDHARDEINKTLNTYVSSLGKKYMASTTAGDMKSSSEEQHVSNTLKVFAKSTLHGVVIIDHWKDPADGTLYSLAKLDMSAIKKTLDDTKELDSKVRDYVRANAEKAFDEVAAEEAKH